MRREQLPAIALCALSIVLASLLSPRYALAEDVFAATPTSDSKTTGTQIAVASNASQTPAIANSTTTSTETCNVPITGPSESSLRDPINWIVFTPTSRLNPKGTRMLSLREIGGIAYSLVPQDWVELRFTTALPIMNIPLSAEATFAKRWAYFSLGLNTRAVVGSTFPYPILYGIAAVSPIATLGTDRTFVSSTAQTFVAFLGGDEYTLWGILQSIGFSHRFKKVRLNIEAIVPYFPGQDLLYEFFALANYEVRFFRPKASFGIGGSYSICSNCGEVQMLLPLGYPIANVNIYF